MDRLDREIIEQLQIDGRLTNAELARRVHLSPTPTLRRVRALEKAGIITGYHASTSPSAMGRSFEVLVSVNLTVGEARDLQRFESAVAAIGEVVEAYRLYGEPDFLLRVAVKDNEAYEQLYSNQLTQLPGVAKVWSQMIMKAIN